MILGAKHVEAPYINLGQICTIVYFAYFIVLVPASSILENALRGLGQLDLVNKSSS